MLAYFFLAKGSTEATYSINQVADGIKDGSIVSILEDGNSLTLTLANGTQAISTKEADSNLVQQLIQYGLTPDQLTPTRIKISVKTPNQWTDVLTVLGYLLPFILLAGMFFFIFQAAAGSNNSAM